VTQIERTEKLATKEETKRRKETKLGIFFLRNLLEETAVAGTNNERKKKKSYDICTADTTERKRKKKRERVSTRVSVCVYGCLSALDW